MARKRKAPRTEEPEASPEGGGEPVGGHTNAAVAVEAPDDANAAAAAAADAAETPDAAPNAPDAPDTTAGPFTALPLRQVHRLLEPGPVLLVSTGAVADGSHNLMTLGFHMMLQHSAPTLVGVCLGPWDASFAALRARRQCVLAVPAAAMAEAVVDVGNCSKDDDGGPVDKWARFGLAPLPAHAVAPPLVGGPHVLANLECVVHDRQLVGRYALWILRVVRAWWRRDVLLADGPDARLLHHRGNGVFAVSGGRHGADGSVIDLHERMTKWPELA